MSNLNNDYISDYKIHLNEFYKNLKISDFNSISVIEILKLKNLSKKFNQQFNNKYDQKLKIQKYLYIIEKIKLLKLSLKENDTYKQIYAYKYILFMFSIDPDFEAAISYGESNKIQEAKNLLEKKLGVFDYNLIRLEHFYLKHFASQKTKEEIKEKILERAFK